MVRSTDQTHIGNRTDSDIISTRGVQAGGFYLNSHKLFTLGKPKNQRRFFGISVNPDLP